jgi:hypothetical protein
MATAMDLKKVNAISLSLRVSYKINDTLRKEIEGLLHKELKVGETNAFATAHKKGEDKWVDIAILEYTKEVEPHLHITFAYGLYNVPNPPRSIPKTKTLLEVLSKKEEPVTFFCETEFLYKEGAKKSIIQLPIPIFRTDRAGFNEIKGVELACTQPAGSEYEISISVSKNGSLRHEVAINCQLKATIGMGSELLKKAVDISKRFLE